MEYVQMFCICGITIIIFNCKATLQSWQNTATIIVSLDLTLSIEHTLAFMSQVDPTVPAFTNLKASHCPDDQRLRNSTFTLLLRHTLVIKLKLLIQGYNKNATQ